MKGATKMGEIDRMAALARIPWAEAALWICQFRTADRALPYYFAYHAPEQNKG